jgi:hypothetical protein
VASLTQLAKSRQGRRQVPNSHQAVTHSRWSLQLSPSMAVGVHSPSVSLPVSPLPSLIVQAQSTTKRLARVEREAFTPPG